jgi:hypothetical protein
VNNKFQPKLKYFRAAERLPGFIAPKFEMNNRFLTPRISMLQSLLIPTDPTRGRSVMKLGKHSACVIAGFAFGLALPAVAQMTSVGIDCSQINALNLLKQENFRAGQALIECGIVPGGCPIVRVV